MRKCTGKSQVSLGWEGDPKTSSQGIWRILEDGTKSNTCVASFLKDGLWRQDLGRFICLSSNWGDFCRDAVAHAPRLLEWNSLQPCEYIFLAKSNLHPKKVFGPPKHTYKAPNLNNYGCMSRVLHSHQQKDFFANQKLDVRRTKSSWIARTSYGATATNTHQSI